MSYVKSKKSFEVRGGIFFIILPCAKKTHDNFNTLPCAKKSTQQTHGFAVCQSRVPRVCRVFICRHLAKLFFAVCPRNCTRQTHWHTANVEFPVVRVGDH